jgi:hypothetical protein
MDMLFGAVKEPVVFLFTVPAEVTLYQPPGKTVLVVAGAGASKFSKIVDTEDAGKVAMEVQLNVTAGLVHDVPISLTLNLAQYVVDALRPVAA